MRHARIAVLALACLQSHAGSAPALAPLPASGIDARITPAQIEALTRQAYFWGLQQTGFYELRYVFTQAQ
ncbi:MAG: DUF1254 domain-containing protein, partial [Cupriavidus sp.]|nr:DUF1254 domain-containing protein [Cupriavidus sp.]